MCFVFIYFEGKICGRISLVVVATHTPSLYANESINSPFVRSFFPNSLTKPRLTPIGFYCIYTMKKLPLFIIVCILVSLLSGCDEWRSSSKPEPKSKPELQPKSQPEKLNSETYTRNLSVACSADGKIVYWISNDTDNFVFMYKSEDGGKTWAKINPRDNGVRLFDFPTENIPTKARTIPRNGK